MRLHLVTALACVVTAVAAATAGHAGSSGPGLVVFWSDDPWPSIWKVAPGGSKPQRILHNRQNAKRPRLSPDRAWVAFDGASPGKPPMSDFDIQLVRLDGTGLRALTNSTRWDVDAQWSPDGRTLSFTGLPPSHEWTGAWTWTIRPDGTRLRRLTYGQGARWSPDGRQLVVAAPTSGSEGDLFLVRADGSNRRLLLASPELDQPADWSADGQRILFTRLSGPPPERASVYVVNADGTGVKRIGPGFAAGFSPDGKKALFAETSPGRLLVMNLDGSGKRPLGGAVGSEPDWR
jgi:Tol biopolymer transport system component